MTKYVSVKAYDGTLVTIPQEKLVEFNLRTQKIKNLLKSGKSKKEITKMLKEGNLDE